MLSVLGEQVTHVQLCSKSCWFLQRSESLEEESSQTVSVSGAPKPAGGSTCVAAWTD